MKKAFVAHIHEWKLSPESSLMGGNTGVDLVNYILIIAYFYEFFFVNSSMQTDNIMLKHCLVKTIVSLPKNEA